MSGRDVTIYGLMDPRSQRVMYIGSTVNTSKRFSRHRRNNHSKRIIQWRDSLILDGLESKFVTLAIVPESSRHDIERSYILQYRPPLNRRGVWTEDYDTTDRTRAAIESLARNRSTKL